MITTNLHPEVLKFFNENGTVVRNNDGHYLYCPFWLKLLPDGKVEFVDWNKMPNDLQNLIIKNRAVMVNFRDGEFKTSDPQLADSLKNSPLNKANKPK